MAYSEPQTPLFPPSYVNLVNKKDHWKIGKSEHNTDCDAYTRPCSIPDASRTIRSSAGIVKKQARTTAKMADHGNKCYVPGCAGDVKCRDGLVSVFRKARKQITHSNKITWATKGTWLAASGSLLQYIRFHLPHKQSKERWLRMMANDLQILSTTDKHLIL